MAEEDDFEQVSSEQEADAPLNGIELLGVHDEGQDAEHKLGEPHAEPVDVILAVGEVVHGLARLEAPAQTLSNRGELLAAREQKEDGHGSDVEVKGEDLIIEPSHNLGVVDYALAALLEHDSGLHHENAKDVDEYFADHEKVANDFPVLRHQHITHKV